MSVLALFAFAGFASCFRSVWQLSDDARRTRDEAIGDLAGTNPSARSRAKAAPTPSPPDSFGSAVESPPFESPDVEKVPSDAGTAQSQPAESERDSTPGEQHGAVPGARPAVPRGAGAATTGDSPKAPRDSSHADPAPEEADAEEKPTFDMIALPSGQTLSKTAISFSPEQVNRLFSKDAPTFSWNYEGGAMGGLVCHQRGKLHGGAAAYYETGEPMTLLTYRESRRDGTLRLWDQSGNITLYAQYTRGNKDGLSCLFKDGRPWLIQLHNKGVLINSYLVIVEQSSYVAIPTGVAAPNKDHASELDESQKRLAELEKEILDGERKLKNRVATWFRTEYKKAQQEYLKKTAPEKRRINSERQRRKAAEQAETVRRFRARMRGE